MKVKKGDKVYLIADNVVSVGYVDEVGFGRRKNGFSVKRADGSETEDGMNAQDVYWCLCFAFGRVRPDKKKIDVYCVRKIWHYPFARIVLPFKKVKSWRYEI